MLQCRLLNVPNVIAVDVDIASNLGDAWLIKEAAMSTLGSSVISKFESQPSEINILKLRR